MSSDTFEGLESNKKLFIIIIITVTFEGLFIFYAQNYYYSMAKSYRAAS
ncbi:MAG: hypothetical protein ACLTK8_03605 [Paeniclostridium sp.]